MKNLLVLGVIWTCKEERIGLILERPKNKLCFKKYFNKKKLKIIPIKKKAKLVWLFAAASLAAQAKRREVTEGYDCSTNGCWMWTAFSLFHETYSIIESQMGRLAWAPSLI